MTTTHPQAGQTALVRHRLARIADVLPYDAPNGGGRVHLVEIEYQDQRLPATDRLVWEREVGTRIIARQTFPKLSDGRLENPERFYAFLDTLRWGAVNRLPDGNQFGSPLLSPWYGAIQVENYQLYPVLKALAMPRISMLLADDVGLGKTIEAGLIISELIARRRVRRVLIVCPANLQSQWQKQMREKFNLEFDRLDRDRVDQISREQGVDANPWRSAPRLITSMDYLRQPAVLEQFESAARAMTQDRSEVLAWDLLIVDEAHNFTPGRFHDDSQRVQMLREITPFFEHKLFLTATPHNGFTVSFTGLLELLDPVRFQQKPELKRTDHEQIQAVMVRRLKEDLNTGPIQRFPKRTVKGLAVDLYPAEVELARALRAYRDEAKHLVGLRGDKADQRVGYFVFSLLTKRLLSSSYAFARTWWNHIIGFDSDEADRATLDVAVRLADQMIEDDQEKTAREVTVARQGAAWLRPHHVQLSRYVDDVSTALNALGWTKERVQSDSFDGMTPPPDAKWGRLADWLREHLFKRGHLRPDERVILFTEYRDTQRYLIWRLQQDLGLGIGPVRELFGGSSRDEWELIESQFNDPLAALSILVGTDALSEGVDLQHACRYMVHQEVPWNPMRMEQRNGRLHRHSQPRDVEIFHFTSNTDEDLRFIGYVVGKLEQARHDLGSVGQIFDKAFQAHFSGAKSTLDQDLALTHAESEENPDLQHRDDGTDQALRQEVTANLLLQQELGLTPERLARFFTVAIRLEGGEIEPTPEPGCFRILRMPPGWKAVESQAFRSERGSVQYPKLTFDAHQFDEVVEGRTVFRPRRDLVLLRLGHPLMQRALASLRRTLWEPGKLQRATAVQSDAAFAGDALLILWVQVTGFNRLREPIHEALVPLPFTVEGAKLNRLPEVQWDAVRRDESRPLEAGALASTQEWVSDHSPAWEGLLQKAVERYRTDEVARLTGLLAKEQESAKKREARAFAHRLKELAEGKDEAAVKKLQTALRKAQSRVAQQNLFDSEAEKAFVDMRKTQADLEKALFAVQESHAHLLRERLTKEQARLIDKVLPARYALADLVCQPVAVELRLPANP